MQVQFDGKVYEIFMQFLRSKSSRTYVKMVDILDAQYALHTGAAAGILHLDPNYQKAREKGTME